MFELMNMDSIRIGLASPEQIRQWSHGEVLKAETINYRTLKDELVPKVTPEVMVDEDELVADEEKFDFDDMDLGDDLNLDDDF